MGEWDDGLHPRQRNHQPWCTALLRTNNPNPLHPPRAHTQMGSRKYGSFLFITTLLATSLEVVAARVSDQLLPASGPFGAIYAVFVLFYGTVQQRLHIIPACTNKCPSPTDALSSFLPTHNRTQHTHDDDSDGAQAAPAAAGLLRRGPLGQVVVLRRRGPGKCHVAPVCVMA